MDGTQPRFQEAPVDCTAQLDCTTPRRILYVEGHDDTRPLMLLVLSRAGYDVTPVSSLTEAQAVLEQSGLEQPGEVAPDLCLLDYFWEKAWITAVSADSRQATGCGDSVTQPK